MSFKISSPGPLVGRTFVPGDRRLTLTTLAMSMLLPEEVTIADPSASPDVVKFLRFLESYGAVIDTSKNNIKLRGKKWSESVLINTDVPDSIIHSVIGSAVFSTRSIKIEDGARSRSIVVRPLLDLLKTVGLPDKNISENGKDVIINGAVFSPPDIVYIGSAWAFEAVISAALSSQKPVVILYPSQLVTHFLRLLTLLGFHITHPEEMNSQNIELSRRLARAAGEKSQEIRKFEWTDKKDEIIKIPGDSTIAAAVCGAAAILHNSDVTVEGVIWEQGRRGFFDALKRMKMNIEWEPNNDGYSFDSANVRIKWSKGEGIHVSSDQALTMSSELLILGAVSAFASGKTVISDNRESPGFERDSFKVFAKGLEMLGSHVGDFSEGIVLHGKQELQGNFIDSGGKADIALALTVTALNSSDTTTISDFGENDYPVGEFLQIVKDITSELLIKNEKL